jgi:hypothetical protein
MFKIVKEFESVKAKAVIPKVVDVEQMFKIVKEFESVKAKAVIPTVVDDEQIFKIAKELEAYYGASNHVISPTNMGVYDEQGEAYMLDQGDWDAVNLLVRDSIYMGYKAVDAWSIGIQLLELMQIPDACRGGSQHITEFLYGTDPHGLPVPGGIRPYAPGHAQYDTWSEGIPRGKQGHTRMRCGHNVE